VFFGDCDTSIVELVDCTYIVSPFQHLVFTGLRGCNDTCLLIARDSHSLCAAIVFKFPYIRNGICGQCTVYCHQWR
jgi:hypothetical protein